MKKKIKKGVGKADEFVIVSPSAEGDGDRYK